MSQDAGQMVSTAVPNLRALNESQSVDRFVAVLAEVIGVEQVDAGEHFLDAGGDSLSTAIIIDWIDQEFGVEPEFDWFFDSETIRDLAARWWAKVRETAQATPA
jgi:acyl carrier protein